MTETTQTQVSAAKAGSAFVTAARSSVFSTITGLAVGALLIIVRFEILTEFPLLQSLIQTVATGFMVGAIGIFFYEWMFHFKERSKLTQKLVDIVDLSSNESLGRFLTNSLADDTRHVPDYLKDVASKIRILVEAISSLQKQDIWAKEEYVAFIGRLIADVCQNANSLQALKSGGEHHFTVAWGADLADEILAAHMKAMTKGDSYHVISNISSWRRQQLKHLHEEERKAITNRGAIVRRVFNLTRSYHPQLDEREVRNILLSHLSDSRDWSVTEGQNSYEVRVLGGQELERSTSRVLRGRIGEAHFGIFRHGNESVRVKVERADLSDMEMSRDPQVVRGYSDLFDEAWSVATPLSEANIEPS